VPGQTRGSFQARSSSARLPASRWSSRTGRCPSRAPARSPSGLRQTDIHAANGDWPVTPTVPFIPGHEGVGIVTKLGDGVTSPQIGQRVAVPWLGYA
jgi:Alcohol dehydrogenase GroES-like domain